MKTYRNGTERRRQRAKTILMHKHRKEYLEILDKLKKQEKTSNRKVFKLREVK